MNQNIRDAVASGFDSSPELAARVPPHTLADLRGYTVDRVPVGDFLTAFLENDLMEAACRADEHNTRCFIAIATFIYNCMPASSHGSPERVGKWLAGKEGE